MWTYEVTAKAEEASFQEVVEQHPLVRKWVETVGEEVERAGVKLGKFDGTEWEAGRV